MTRTIHDAVRVKAPLGVTAVSIGSVEYEVDDNGFFTVDPDYVSEHLPLLTMHLEGIEYERTLKHNALTKTKENTTAGQMQLLAEHLVSMFGSAFVEAMKSKVQSPPAPPADAEIHSTPVTVDPVNVNVSVAPAAPETPPVLPTR